MKCPGRAMRVARGKPLRHIIVVAFAWWAVSLCIALASGIKGPDAFVPTVLTPEGVAQHAPAPGPAPSPPATDAVGVSEAIARGDIDGIDKWLLGGGDPNACVDCAAGGVSTALHLVASAWRTADAVPAGTWAQMVDKLVAAGADPNQADYSLLDGATPLAWAVLAHASPDDSGRGEEVIRALLRHGADPNFRWTARGLSGDAILKRWSPLHAAAAMVDLVGPGVLQALLEAGADPFAEDGASRAPVHLLAQCSTSNATCGGGSSAGKALQEWLQARPSLALAKGPLGQLPLDFATTCVTPVSSPPEGRPFWPEADLCTDRTRDLTCTHGPCDACCATYLFFYAEAVTDGKAAAEGALRRAVTRGDVAGVRDAVAAGADVDACLECPRGSRAAIHIAASGWATGDPSMRDVWPEMIRVLVQELGADPDLMSFRTSLGHQRQPALAWALENHRVSETEGDTWNVGESLPTITALLDVGADVNKPYRKRMTRPGVPNTPDDPRTPPVEVEGWTVLHDAASKIPYAGGDVLEALVDAGADVNARNARGETPLFFAAWCGNYNLQCGKFRSRAPWPSPAATSAETGQGNKHTTEASLATPSAVAPDMVVAFGGASPGDAPPGPQSATPASASGEAAATSAASVDRKLRLSHSQVGANWFPAATPGPASAKRGPKRNAVAHLLAAGADPDVRSRDGVTALYLATACVKPLDGLESGQSVCRGGARDVECPWGVQPCSDCCETYFILEAATGPQAKLVSALAQVDDAAVTAAVRAGADVNACLFCGDADHELWGMSAVHVASVGWHLVGRLGWMSVEDERSRWMQVLDTLLSLGADPNQPTHHGGPKHTKPHSARLVPSGTPPLAVALAPHLLPSMRAVDSRGRSLSTVLALLQAGALPGIQYPRHVQPVSLDGRWSSETAVVPDWTPLHEAVMGSALVGLGVAQALVEAGADANAPAGGGIRPVHLAASCLSPGNTHCGMDAQSPADVAVRSAHAAWGATRDLAATPTGASADPAVTPGPGYNLNEATHFLWTGNAVLRAQRGQHTPTATPVATPTIALATTPTASPTAATTATPMPIAAPAPTGGPTAVLGPSPSPRSLMGTSSISDPDSEGLGAGDAGALPWLVQPRAQGRGGADASLPDDSGRTALDIAAACAEPGGMDAGRAQARAGKRACEAIVGVGWSGTQAHLCCEAVHFLQRA